MNVNSIKIEMDRVLDLYNEKRISKSLMQEQMRMLLELLIKEEKSEA